MSHSSRMRSTIKIQRMRILIIILSSDGSSLWGWWHKTRRRRAPGWFWVSVHMILLIGAITNLCSWGWWFWAMILRIRRTKQGAGQGAGTGAGAGKQKHHGAHARRAALDTISWKVRLFETAAPGKLPAFFWRIISKRNCSDGQVKSTTPAELTVHRLHE